MFHRAGLATKGLIFIAFLILVGCGGGSSVNPICANHTTENLTLTSLNVGSYDIGFSSNILNGYSVDVENDVTSINITALLNSTALGNGAKISAKLNAIYTLSESTTPVISSGTEFTVELSEGDNFIKIEVESANGCQSISYDLVVHRKNTKAVLDAIFLTYPSSGSLTYDDDNNSDTSSVTFNSSVFDEAVFNYDITASYAACYVAIAPIPVEERSSITVNGEEATRSVYSYFNLPLVGTTTIAITIGSEVGDNSATYTFNITRTSTDEQLAEDALLQDMQLSTGLASDFLCNTSSYTATIDRNDTTATELTLSPAAPGSTMSISQIVNGVEPTFSDATVMTADTPFDLQVSTVPGIYNYEVTVTSTDASVTRLYFLSITRRETNRVYVDSATTLQEAIKNAVDYDEIVIETNTDDDQYLGIASVETSGSDEAHFYAGFSPENKIIVRGDGGTVILKGDDTTQKTVFLIEGDNWEVKNLALTDALNGLELRNANNNFIAGITISSVGERGAIIHENSSNNVLASNNINNTGLIISESDTVVESDTEFRGEAIVVGSETCVNEGESANCSQNNYISNTFIGGAPTESVDVKGGAIDTQFKRNVISNTTIDLTYAENSSVVSIDGSGTEYANNTLLHSNAVLIDSGISLNGDAKDVKLFDNVFSFFEELFGLSFVGVTSEENVTAGQINNKLTDGELIEFSGSGTITEIESPIYQIQYTTALGETLCLVEKEDVSFDYGSYQRSDTENILTADMIVMDACVADEPTQQWEIEYYSSISLSSLLAISFQNYVVIRNVSSELALATSSANFATTLTFLTESSSTSLTAWKLNKLGGEGFSFTPYSNTSYAITSTGSDSRVGAYFSDGETAVFMKLYNASNAQTFTLVEQ